MLIEFRITDKKYIAEVWGENPQDSWTGFKEPFPEEQYIAINQWCIETFGYHARTAYHVFEFKKQADLEWFILKWGSTNFDK